MDNVINRQTKTPTSVTVSVIIPTRNRPRQLLKAVQSVLAQTFQDFEIIIVDDASTVMLNTMNKAFQDKRVRIIRNETPQGGSLSRNHGIFQSIGKWLAFLDDDDIWQPQKLEQQLAMLARNPQAIAVTSAYTVHYPGAIKKNVFPPAQITLAKLLENNCLGGASVCMCDAQVIKKLGGFNRHLRSAQDWDVWVRLRMQGEIVTVAKPAVDYYVHFSDRISNNMQAKYQGARRFYFLYKKMMTPLARKKNLQFICFIKSRQIERSLRARLKNLTLALRKNTIKIKLSYVLSSLPRMLVSRL